MPIAEWMGITVITVTAIWAAAFLSWLFGNVVDRYFSSLMRR